MPQPPTSFDVARFIEEVQTLGSLLVEKQKSWSRFPVQKQPST